MIGRHPVFQSGRKEELLSVIGGDESSHIQLDALSNELFKKCHFGFETVSSRAALPIKGGSKSIKVDQSDVRVRQSLTPPGFIM
jgi:hypothetical protein